MSEKGSNSRGVSNRKSSPPTLNPTSAEDGHNNNAGTTSSVCSMSSSTATVTASRTNLAVQQNALLSQQLKRLAAQKLQQPQDSSSAAGLSSYSTPSPPTKRRRSGSFDKRVVTSGQVQPHENKRIGFIGAGNMARAIAEGWINSGKHRLHSEGNCQGHVQMLTIYHIGYTQTHTHTYILTLGQSHNGSTHMCSHFFSFFKSM